jgi:hypothetical protein
MAIRSDTLAKTMPSGGEVALERGVTSPMISIYPVQESIVEGGIVRYQVVRSEVESTACAIRWRAYTNVDIIIGPTSNVLNFDPGDIAIEVSIQLADLTGTQGDRFFSVALEDPLGCVISPIAPTAQVLVKDRTTVVNWGNGFTDRIRIVLPPFGSNPSLGVLVWLNDTIPELKSNANGGRVLSATAVTVPYSRTIPYDVRFEYGGDANGSGGMVFPHRVRTYDPVTGRIVTAFRIMTEFGVAEPEVWLYFGKNGLTTSEENIPGLCADHLGWWTMPDGTDLVQGKNFTVSGVTSGTIQDGPSGTWAGGTTALAQFADGSYMNGASDISVWALVDMGAAIVGQDRGVVYQGTIANAGSNGFILGVRGVVSASLNNVWQCRFTVTGGSHDFYALSDTAKAGEYMVACSRTPGQQIVMVVDGKLMVAGTSIHATGTVVCSALPIGLGVGPRNAIRWTGEIAETGVMSKILNAFQWQIFQDSFSRPRQTYGVSPAQSFDESLPFVAMPVSDTIVNDTTSTADVIGFAKVPPGTDAVTISALRNPVGGTFAIVTIIVEAPTTAVKYTPTPNYVGKASVDVELQRGELFSWTQFIINVTAPVAPSKAELSIEAAVTEINEGDVDAIFNVTRGGNLDVVATVHWAKSGTTTAADFATGAVFSGDLTFNATEVAKQITMRLKTDTLSDDGETIIVTLSAPSSNANIVTGADTDTMTVKTPTVITAAQWYANPLTKDMVHHRLIGEGATFGIPPGITIEDWNANRKTTYTSYAAKNYSTYPNDSLGWLRNTAGDFTLGISDQGRKGFWFVSPTDSLVNFKKGTYSGGVWTATGETYQIRVPPGDTVRGGTGNYYFVYDGSDFEVGFFPRNGAADVNGDFWVDQFTDFDWTGPWYSRHESWRMTDKDWQLGVGASRMCFPPTLALRGVEINPDAPGAILHSLMCTATRKNSTSTGATAAQHLLSKLISWPSSGVDKSANPNATPASAYDPTCNQGRLPYGSLLCVQRGADYDAVKTDIGTANKRGLALLDCFATFGCYVVDGQSEASGPTGAKKGVFKLRVDHLVGNEANGNPLNNSSAKFDEVKNDCNAGLRAILKKISVVNNPRQNNSETQRAGDGFCYNGGGGRPVLNLSRTAGSTFPAQFINNALA